MDELLLAGPAEVLLPLRTALEHSPWTVGGVQRTAELEQAIRSSRAALIVIADGFCDPSASTRLRRMYGERMLVAWLPRASSARAAELLEQGYVEVLSPALGRSELLARLRNAGDRRSAPMRHPVALGLLSVDAAHGLAAWDGRDLRLTRRERQLLQVLAETYPQTRQREDLYRSVWGYAMARGDRTVDVNVKRLRAKLAAVTDELTVATEPGVGYRLELQAAPVAVTGL